MIYLAIDKLEPNSASANHFLGIVKHFHERNIPFKLVTFLPNPKERVRECELYDYYNLAVDCPVKINWIVRLWNKLFEILFLHRRLRRFARRLSADDSLFIYTGYRGLAELIDSGCRLFLEYTEHPDVHDYISTLKNRKDEVLREIARAAGVFVISTSLRNYYIATGVSPERISIVNMFVDSTRFLPVKKRPVATPYIAYCGTASNNKDGVDRLLKAFAIVAKEIDDVDLYLIGKTPTRKESRSNLNLIDQLGINDRVRFTGIISREEMPQTLTNAAVLALARPDSQQARNGFPTKLGEYLLSGNPVVVTKTGDIPLFLEDGVSAYLVEPDDIEGFARKLTLALKDKDAAMRIGRAGYEVAMKNFNYQIEADKIVSRICSGEHTSCTDC